MYIDDRLDERKRRILRAIIDDYIDTAEPLGSRTIAKRHEIGLSSATIRNEMADLEEMGYLSQPHTSSGRIPSNRGYRFYVDQLMPKRELTPEEIENIRCALDFKISELTQLIKQASILMSKVTKYTSMAITPRLKESRIKAVQVVSVNPFKVLVIVVTNANIIRNTVVTIFDNITSDAAIMISNFLNSKISGLTKEQLDFNFVNDLKREVYIKDEILIPIIEGIKECLDLIDEPDVFLEGASNILNFPEFSDIMKAKDFLNVLEEKSLIYKMMSKLMGKKINVQIGTENEIEEINNCTLITATYNHGDIVLGTIGVIGPTRMEYSRVIALLNHIRKKINEEISKLIGSSDNINS